MYSFIFDLKKSDESNNILFQYENDNTLKELKNLNKLNLITKTNEITSLSIEEHTLKFLSLFYSYDSIHYVHIALKGYTHSKNLAFLPLFSYTLKTFNSIFYNYIYSFKYNITSILFSGFIISNFLCLLNTILLAIFFNKIIDINDAYGGSLFRRIILLFLYNPGSIFFVSIYTENLYFSLHLLILFYLINNPPEKLTSLNNIFTISSPLFIAIGLRSNSILLFLYFLVPIIVLMLRGFDNDNKTILGNVCKNTDNDIKYKMDNNNKLVKTEIKKECFNENKFSTNLLFSLKCFLTNKFIIIKCLLIILFAFFGYYFTTRILPKNTICDGLGTKIRSFRDNELLKAPNSSFKIVNNTIFQNNVSLNTFDISVDPFYKICSNFSNTDIYGKIQKDYWNTGFLYQLKLLPNNLDRFILSIPINILSLLYVICYFKKHFNLKALLYNFNLPKFMRLEIYYYEDIRQIFKTYKIDTDDNDNFITQYKTILKSFKEYVTQFKAIMLCGVIYHFILTIIIFLFGHFQINNRLLSCSPMFYLFLAEALTIKPDVLYKKNYIKKNINKFKEDNNYILTNKEKENDNNFKKVNDKCNHTNNMSKHIDTSLINLINTDVKQNNIISFLPITIQFFIREINIKIFFIVYSILGTILYSGGYGFA